MVVVGVIAIVLLVWLVTRLIAAHRAVVDVITTRDAAVAAAAPKHSRKGATSSAADLLDVGKRRLVSQSDFEAGLGAWASRAGTYAFGSAPPCAHRLFREACAVFVGGPAILLQLAHPYVATGVQHHSYTKGHPARRFQRTFEYVLGIAFGTTDAAVKHARTVRSVHNRIVGSIEGDDAGPRYPAGSTYTAAEQTALLWVWATLTDGVVFAHEVFVGPISETDKEEFYQYALQQTPVWGLSPDILPQEWNSFEQYFYSVCHSDHLAATGYAKATARFLFTPPAWERVFGVNVLQRSTTLLTPEPVRAMYGYGLSPAERGIGLWMLALMRVVYGLVPLQMRSWTKYVAMTHAMQGVSSLGLLATVSNVVASAFVRAFFYFRRPAPEVAELNTNAKRVKKVK